MNARRWVVLALVLFLGMLIGYSVAPTARYTVGRYGGDYDLYRYDIRTGKTWRYFHPSNPNPFLPGSHDIRTPTWEEIPEPNQVVPLPQEKK